MNDELTPFELELKAFRPRSISPGLENRIAAELGINRPGRYWFRRYVLLSAAAAVIFGFFGWAAYRAKPSATAIIDGEPSTAEVAYKPVTAQNLYLGSRDEGLITLDGGMPARRVRSYYVDTITWRNPATNASMSWTVPREEMRVWPASVH